LDFILELSGEKYSGKLTFNTKDKGSEIIKVKNGFRNGKTVFMDKDGKVVNKVKYKKGIQD
jgi:antitoxin component YwqK of YwqJK toxin-antitoxin module